jgi:hypothetical protein
MQELERMTLEEMKEFVECNRKLRFEGEDRERGVVRRFLVRVSGLSRAQTARLIGEWMAARQIRCKEPVRRSFPTRYRTPFEKLCSLPNWEQHLKPGMSAAALERQARQLSDTEAACQMQKAK